MEENTIGESISRLIESIKESPEYKEFKKQRDILRVGSGPEDTGWMHFRGENYRIQNECDADEPVRCGGADQ